MKEVEYTQDKQNIRIKKKKRKLNLIRLLIIIILCLITFLGGRASAAVSHVSDENQDKPAAAEPLAGQWNLLLINKNHPVPENFNVELVQLKNGQAFDQRAYPDLQNMMEDARASGLSPYICSSYRTMEKQTTLYNKQVEKYQEQGYSLEDAKEQAGKWVAVPGTSEHQIGLAVDIVAESNQVLDKSQENTAEQIWLMENCYKYGFILRYPDHKSDITGIGYEPWHYRYVGKEAAAEITQRGICLEEYLDTFYSAPKEIDFVPVSPTSAISSKAYSTSAVKFVEEVVAPVTASTREITCLSSSFCSNSS
ncbi:M15 family metallopeptidase [Sinanaerobacter chloroacetimidivorans]|jgi:D-alanyl-D-alanine carboxypeptidase|uniref:M15 family metallopeptidase n=1 Tax=Sinanaerobacter chloroacetimidivorans TaxID=2818044 RepID=UPI001D05C1CB|nr:M15 family metallopeptidase [Sinanaerobacter chloroacetimidivorans]